MLLGLLETKCCALGFFFGCQTLKSHFQPAQTDTLASSQEKCKAIFTYLCVCMPVDTVRHRSSVKHSGAMFPPFPSALLLPGLVPALTKQLCVLPGHKRGCSKVRHLSFIVYSESCSFEPRSMQLLEVLENVLNYHQPNLPVICLYCSAVHSGCRPQAPAKPPEPDSKSRHERHNHTPS